MFLSLAQTVDATVDASRQLLQYGVLGIFCILLIGALVWVVKWAKKSMEDRVADAKGFADALKAVNDGSANLVVASNATNEALKTSFELLKQSINSDNVKHVSAIAKLEEEIDKLREKQGELVAEVRGRGKNA